MRKIFGQVLIALFLLQQPALMLGLVSPSEHSLHVRGAYWAVVVPDINASIAWYNDKLGMRLIKRSKAPGKNVETAVVGADGLFVELIQYGNATVAKIETGQFPLGIMKTGAIISDEQYQTVLDRLRASGLQFVGKEFEDKEMGSRTFIVRDNSGNLIQFFSEPQ